MGSTKAAVVVSGVLLAAGATAMATVIASASSGVHDPDGVEGVTAPRALAGDPGGLPVYDNGVLGVEDDGRHSLDTGPEREAADDVAVAAQTPDHAAPATIRAGRGVRLHY